MKESREAKNVMESGKPTVSFRCCICHELIKSDDPDGYALQVRKFVKTSPEAVWAHGVCLRRVMPVIGDEVPGTGSLH